MKFLKISRAKKTKTSLDDPTTKTSFCADPKPGTPPSAMSPEQRKLLTLTSSVVASANSKDGGKYRAIAAYVRLNLTKLRGTENRLLVTGGILKSAASDLIRVAKHADEKTFDKWQKGTIGFRGALLSVRALQSTKMTVTGPPHRRQRGT